LGEYRARTDRLFNRLDAGGDGRLDRQEIVSGVGRTRLRNALERADINLDDHVSHQEFQDLATRAYQRLDADGNGVVTEAEFEAGDPLASD
ncbi:MAG: EF-hand domain-containing protein, partial [Brevundimonas sp.]